MWQSFDAAQADTERLGHPFGRPTRPVQIDQDLKITGGKPISKVDAMIDLVGCTAG